MRVLRYLHAMRLFACVYLFGLLVSASGCGEQNPVASIDPETSKAKGDAQRQAREAAYGKGGMPPPSTKASAKKH
jgi:hypothetical protein